MHFIRGYHEIGTHKPKLSFTEIIRDAKGDPILGVDRKPIRKTHGHTWVVKQLRCEDAHMSRWVRDLASQDHEAEEQNLGAI